MKIFHWTPVDFSKIGLWKNIKEIRANIERSAEAGEKKREKEPLYLMYSPLEQ